VPAAGVALANSSQSSSLTSLWIHTTWSSEVSRLTSGRPRGRRMTEMNGRSLM
jgi:hypothetical protein